MRKKIKLIKLESEYYLITSEWIDPGDVFYKEQDIYINISIFEDYNIDPVELNLCGNNYKVIASTNTNYDLPRLNTEFLESLGEFESLYVLVECNLTTGLATQYQDISEVLNYEYILDSNNELILSLIDGE